MIKPYTLFLRTIIAVFFAIIGFDSFAQPQPKMLQIGEESGYNTKLPTVEFGKDRNNNIWILTVSGLLRYNSVDFHGTRTGGVNKGNFNHFFENEEGLICVTDQFSQLFFVENSRLKTYQFNDTIRKIVKNRSFYDADYDKNKSFHVSVQNLGYFRVDSLGGISYPFQDEGIEINGLACVLNGNQDPFVIDRFNNLNEEDSSQYFYLFNDENELLYRYPIQKSKENVRHSIIKLTNNNYLFSSGRGHLIEFNKKEIVREIDYDATIIALLCDKNGGIWISTFNGIHHYKEGVISKEKRRIIFEGKPSIAGVEDFEGGIWLSTEGYKLNRIADPTCDYYNEGNSMFDHNVSVMDAFKNTLYFAGEGEYGKRLNLLTNELDSFLLPVSDNGNPVTKKEKMDMQGVISLKYDQLNDRLWISKRGRLYYQNKEKGWTSVTSQKLGTSTKVYLRTASNVDSISMIGLFGKQFFLANDTSIFYTSDPYPSKINSIYVNKDSIWVHTNQGSFLQLPNERIDLKKKYPFFKNIVHETVYFNNKVWFSSYGGGVCYFDKDSLNFFRNSGGVVKNASLIERKEELWIFNGGFSHLLSKGADSVVLYKALPYFSGSAISSSDHSFLTEVQDNMIYKFDFADIKKREIIYPYQTFENIKINREPAKKGQTEFLLTHDQNYIDITYLSKTFEKWPAGYKYRILGLRNEDWTITPETNLQFVELPPGEYTFQLQSRTWFCDWSEPKSLHFKISPPFWKTWWFILICIVVVAFIIYKVIAYRIKVIEREKTLLIKNLVAEQKALRAKMDPHFVFNIITSIQYFILEKKNDEASRFLQLFANLMRNTLDQTDGENITIEQEVEFLREYIEMEKFRLMDWFDFKIEVDKNVNQVKEIPNFLIQPLVENAIEHGIKNNSEKGLLSIRISAENNVLKVIVEDNGVGYNQTLKSESFNKRKSHGVKTIEERLELNNGKEFPDSFTIIDLSKQNNSETGTKAIIKIKLR